MESYNNQGPGVVLIGPLNFFSLENANALFVFVGSFASYIPGPMLFPLFSFIPKNCLFSPPIENFGVVPFVFNSFSDLEYSPGPGIPLSIFLLVFLEL